MAEPKCELGFDENLATCPMLKIFAGKTEATKGFGENSTASAVYEELPGKSIVMVSVMVTVLVFTVGFGVGFGAATALAAGEQTDCIQRSAASAERGMLAIWEALGQLTAATTGFGA